MNHQNWPSKEKIQKFLNFLTFQAKMIIINSGGSQFTNEELKLLLGKTWKVFLISVRNLPMRSWNLSMLDLISLRIEKFAIYQWGVETRWSKSNLCEYFYVRNLPMRSWNGGVRLKFAPHIRSSQFTNEELKLVQISYFKIPNTVRNLPMRSWNFMIISENT